MSHRSLRSILIPVASGIAAAIAVSWPGPALAAGGYDVAGSIQAGEWWLGALHVTQAWETTEGAGITVAVLGTGVAAGHPPDLAGSVTAPVQAHQFAPDQAGPSGASTGRRSRG